MIMMIYMSQYKSECHGQLLQLREEVVRVGYQGWTFQNSDFRWCSECNLSSCFSGPQFDGAVLSWFINLLVVIERSLIGFFPKQGYNPTTMIVDIM
ncbi:hypothetical protein QL285_050401 [Trifolium repens]|nr:hypothetical protein QL285_050401 [Trifolium repens]